jgi:hypothetical protein
MKNLPLIILLAIFPTLSFAKAPNCYSWPMNMTKMWMRNTRIVDFKNLEESKTKITLLASEKKGKDGMATHIQTTKLRGSRLLNSTGGK